MEQLEVPYFPELREDLEKMLATADIHTLLLYAEHFIQTNRSNGRSLLIGELQKRLYRTQSAPQPRRYRKYR